MLFSDKTPSSGKIIGFSEFYGSDNLIKHIFGRFDFHHFSVFSKFSKEFTLDMRIIYGHFRSKALELIFALFYLQILARIAYYQISRKNFSYSKLRLSPWSKEAGFDFHNQFLFED